jgi:membrane-associated phospholipid phosphatase
MLRPLLPLALAAVVAYAAVPTAAAQPVAPDSLGAGLDVAALRAVYALDAPALTAALRAADRTSYAVFALIPAGTYAAAQVGGTSTVPAVRLGLSGALAGGTALVLKRVVGRARPFQTVPGITSRRASDYVEAEVDPHAFPSGHASLAFALATSASLSAPQWYVVAPAVTWASTVALARVWHGVHYPSDILAGAALGAGSAALVHVLLPDGDGTDAPAVLHIVVPL